MFICLRVFTIHRSVHTRKLEGDGNNTSRHANEGLLLILLMYDGRQPEANVEELLKMPKLRKGQKCVCLTISLQVNMNEKVTAHRKTRTPPYEFLVF